MEQQHKEFILEKLIPFIKREQGNGFCMEHWQESWEQHSWRMDEDNRWLIDGVYHLRPACDTVACIGGSAEILNRQLTGCQTDAYDLFGLEYPQARGLFYGWMKPNAEMYEWPAEYMQKYREAKTPAAKAEVACELLKFVVETDGACIVKNLQYGGTGA